MATCGSHRTTLSGYRPRSGGLPPQILPARVETSRSRLFLECRAMYRRPSIIRSAYHSRRHGSTCQDDKAMPAGVERGKCACCSAVRRLERPTIMSLLQALRLRVAAVLAAAVVCSAQVTFTEYPGPTTPTFESGDALEYITLGPDGNLWFTENYAFGVPTQIGRITPSGVMTLFSIPSGSSEGGITAGPDGNVWFTEYRAGKIGRITPAGVITEFSIPSGGNPQDITLGPDGNLWFTDALAKIGKITPAGVITEFSTSNCVRIAAGPDGNLWFTENLNNKIGRITTAGVITEFPIPTSGSYPTGITAAPDGNLWFTEDSGNKIGRITPAGVFTEFPIPTANSDTEAIAVGPDGNVWFTERQGNKIGTITAAGVITEISAPTSASQPMGIAAGPGGTLWFLESNADRIVKVQLSAAVSAPMITSLGPNGSTAGGPAFTLTVNGAGFVSGATVQWNGSPLPTMFGGATQLTATVAASLISSAGTATVTVVNPGGLTSNAATFTITVPTPSISSLSPNSATAGGSAFTLTVNVSGFLAGSTILWNGSALSTNYLNGAQLTASVPATQIASQGTASVTVANPGVGTSNAITFTTTAPNRPTITSISPNIVPFGGFGAQCCSGFTLTVNGTNFTPNESYINFDGVVRCPPTTFVNSTQLTCNFDALSWTSGGYPAPSTINVTVTTQGGTSNAVTLRFVVPSLSGISPNSVAAGSGTQTIILNGADFVSGAQVVWAPVGNVAASYPPVTYINSNQLSVSVAANLVATQGTASVLVHNPGGSNTSAVAFPIPPPAPSLSSLSPASATAGGPAFTLTVNGSGFLAGSIVLWNGSALSTNYVGGTQLTASVPANQIASQGTASVTVSNPGVGTSNAVTFTINAPTPSISTLSPNSATAGGLAFILTINGSGFLSGSIVQWNGSALSTNYVSGTQLTASVPATQIASQGTASVTVANPGVGTSNGVTFTINVPTPSISTLSPNSATAGGPAFTLTINGSGFLAGSIVQWNGSALSTNYVSGTQLTASVSTNQVAFQGSAGVTVQNPGGATSNASAFAINAVGGLTVLTSSPLPSGAVGVPYSQGLSATGGSTPYKGWAVTAGSVLPPGISLTQGLLSGTGLLSGNPTSGGTFTFTLQVTDNNNAIATRQFTLNITGGSVTLSTAGIVNAASYVGGQVSPGEIITIFGSFPGPATLVTLQLDSRGFVSTNLGGAQVLFDGVQPPMIYAEAGQVSCVVPYEVSGKGSTQVQVSYQGQVSNSVAMPVSAVVPGVFTVDSSGQGQGAIVNQNGTINSANNPAAAGSIVSVYATGEGQTNPGGIDGKPDDSPTPVPVTQPVTATVGGINAQVQYAGGVSGLVAGVLQVNIVIPQGIAAGGSVPIVFTIGTVSSQANVTLAIGPSAGGQAVR